MSPTHAPLSEAPLSSPKPRQIRINAGVAAAIAAAIGAALAVRFTSKDHPAAHFAPHVFLSPMALCFYTWIALSLYWNVSARGASAAKSSESRGSRGAVAPGLAVLLLAASCAPRAKPMSAPTLRIVATDSSFVLPAVVSAGITELRLVNHGRTVHEGILTHFLTPTATAAAYVESVRAGVEMPAFAEDVGGPGLAQPGDSTRVWMDLRPGRYAVLCWYDDHVAHGVAKEFEVVAARSVAIPPSADLGVRMRDYTYEFEGNWTAGPHVVRVENAGREPHEFDPYRLLPGHTPEDFFRWIETGRPGPAPAVALGGSGSFVPGQQVWLPLTLSAGRHFAFCQVPARADQQPHYRHGMVREFSVR